MPYLTTPVSVAIGLALVCGSALAQQPIDVKWANERLAVRASGAPLSDVLAEVARLTGIEVVGRDKLAGLVSIDFADLAPKDALARLLSHVNYVVQERPGSDGGSARQLVVSIHSMAGYALPADVFSGPLEVPALDKVAAEEAEDAQDEAEDEADSDADAFLEEAGKDKIAAARLASEGAFGPKADVASIVKHAQNLYNDEIRLEAVKALGARPMSAVLEPLVKTLGDETWEVRAAVVDILGRAKDRQSLQAVGEVLKKADGNAAMDPRTRDARIDALRIFQRRGDPASAPYLRAVLEDSDALIRSSAERMLAELDRRERAKAENRP